MIWQPPLHPSAVVLGLVAAVVTCVVMIARARTSRSRRWCIIGLRTTAMGAILTLLLGPSVADSHDPDRPARTLHVLVDVSPSMSVDSPARFQQARQAIETLPTAARWWAFADSVVEATEPPTAIRDAATGTALFQAVQTVSSRAAVGDIVLVISDGHDTTGQSARTPTGIAKARDVTLFALPVGSFDPRRIILTANPKRLFTGETVNLRYSAFGFGPDEPVVIDRDGKVIQQTNAGDADAVTDVPFRDDMKTDVATYRLQVGDEQPLSAWASVSHLGRRLRVLMIEGKPSWNTRFVADALRADSHIDLTLAQSISPKRHLLMRYSPSASDEQEPPAVAIPISVDDLRAFDLIVVGDAIDRCLTPGAVQSVPRHVAGGAGLVMIGESVADFTPAMPAFADESLKMSFGRIGAGRVVQIDDRQVWRSLFVSTDDAEREAGLSALRAAARWAALGDPAPPESPAARDESDEMLDTTARPDVLQELAEATGGELLSPGDLSPLFDALAEPRNADRPDDADLRPAWPRPWVFALIVVPLIAEWFIRRTGGLP